MNEVLIKHLALAIDKRLAVFKTNMQDGSILLQEMQLNTAAYMISEIVMPCCCMLCNRNTLQGLLEKTKVCGGNRDVIMKLADLVYADLARCNGLG